MLILLDENLKHLATIRPDSEKNFFFDETIKRQIAEDQSSNGGIVGAETFNKISANANSISFGDEITNLTMLADSPASIYLKSGNYIAAFDDSNNKYRVYRISNVVEKTHELTGNHMVVANAVNFLIWKLNKTIPAKKSIKQCNIKVAMEWILAGTGWDLRLNTESALTAPMDFDGSTSSQAYLQQILAAYDCEVQAYVEFNAAGMVDDLIVELVDHLGSENPSKTIRYGLNMKGISRETVDTNLITKLYVFGGNGTSIGSVNGGKNFVTDRQANDRYSPDSETWLEGTITSSKINQPAALMDWAKKQLLLFNHPRINYTVNASSSFHANLGDEVKIIDNAMTPALTVQARVIQVNESLSNPANSNIVLGEFSTAKIITPNFIRSMENRWNDHVKQAFEEIKRDSKAASLSIITPLGRTWYNDEKTKKAIARIFIKGENLTSYLSPESFEWEKINRDGTHDYAWEQNHKHAGYEVEIEYPFDAVLQCNVNDQYIHDQAEVWIDTSKNNENETFKKIWQSKQGYNHWNDVKHGYLQCSILLNNGGVLASYAYRGKKSSPHNGYPKISDTEFLRYDSQGNLLDSMILHGGGHGSAFSYDEATNTIYTVCQPMSGGSYNFGTISYQANTEQNFNNFNKYVEMTKFMRTTVDFKHGYVLGSNLDGTIMTFRLSDLQQNNFQPLIQCKLQDFGINPTPSGSGTDGRYNTIQSNGLDYPFAYFTSGDGNNKDDRILLCVNMITQSKEFDFIIEPYQDIELQVPLENGGKMEPEGVYYDNNNQRLILGINISKWTDESRNWIEPTSAIYSFPLGFRDDTKDLAIKYPIDDSNVVVNDSVYEATDSDSDYEDISDTIEFGENELDKVASIDTPFSNFEDLTNFENKPIYTSQSEANAAHLVEWSKSKNGKKEIDKVNKISEQYELDKMQKEADKIHY